MVVFRRIKTREHFEGETEWSKGYEFSSIDYDLDPINGYAIDSTTQRHHDIKSLECVEPLDPVE